jgi:hypothetical protein
VIVDGIVAIAVALAPGVHDATYACAPGARTAIWLAGGACHEC